MSLAEHEKSTCHIQAGVQWFEAEQMYGRVARWVQFITLITCRSTKLSLCLAICECAVSRKETLLQSAGTTLRTPPAPTPLNESGSAAQLGKAKIVNVIQHTHSCLSYWTAICFYLINQPCAFAFGTFFSTSMT